MQEMQVRFLGREDLLWKDMATHSSVLAWEIPWTEIAGGLQSRGCHVRHDRAHAYIFYFFSSTDHCKTLNVVPRALR